MRHRCYLTRPVPSPSQPKTPLQLILLLAIVVFWVVAFAISSVRGQTFPTTSVVVPSTQPAPTQNVVRVQPGSTIPNPVPDNTWLIFSPGTYVFPRPLVMGSNTAAYADGTVILRPGVEGSTNAFFTVPREKSKVLIHGFQFSASAQGWLWRCVTGGGSDIYVLRNVIDRCSEFTNWEAKPRGVLVWKNRTLSEQSIDRYFVWLDGDRVFVVDNFVHDSLTEHCVRVSTATNFLIRGNKLHNKPNVTRRPDGTTVTTVKSSIWAMSHGPGLIDYNECTANISLAPLGDQTGSNLPETKLSDVRVFSNSLIGGQLKIGYGTHNLDVQGNWLETTGDYAAVVVDYFDPHPAYVGKRSISNIQFRDNYLVSWGTRGSLFQLGNASRTPLDPLTPGLVSFYGNKLVMRNATYEGWAAAMNAPHPEFKKLFRTITLNTWPKKPRLAVLGGRQDNQYWRDIAWVRANFEPEAREFEWTQKPTFLTQAPSPATQPTTSPVSSTTARDARLQIESCLLQLESARLSLTRALRTGERADINSAVVAVDAAINQANASIAKVRLLER